jgi:diadenosine tetraphosphatase ApaH/serine/threonine PP2A family protein phosphatase
VRYLILSDIHANAEALEAVVQNASGQYQDVLCCGDLIGYGADPNAVVDWVRTNCSLVIRGNHDRACTGMEDLEWFNPAARAAAVWTRRALTPENLDWTRGLPSGPAAAAGFQLFHGSPSDEDEYMVGAEEAGLGFQYLECRMAFFGHTHIQGGFIWNHSRVETIPGMPTDRDTFCLPIDPGCGYLINPGSVGQPRDGDPRAAYTIYDSEGARVFYFRVPYDLGTAQSKIRAAGLPPILADRLSVGR